MTNTRTVWVVIDEGCYECGVDSEGVGIFATEAEGRAAKEARDGETGGWRDGGMTHARLFEMATP